MPYDCSAKFCMVCCKKPYCYGIYKYPSVFYKTCSPPAHIIPRCDTDWMINHKYEKCEEYKVLDKEALEDDEDSDPIEAIYQVISVDVSDILRKFTCSDNKKHLIDNRPKELLVYYFKSPMSYVPTDTTTNGLPLNPYTGHPFTLQAGAFQFVPPNNGYNNVPNTMYNSQPAAYTESYAYSSYPRYVSPIITEFPQFPQPSRGYELMMRYVPGVQQAPASGNNQGQRKQDEEVMEANAGNFMVNAGVEPSVEAMNPADDESNMKLFIRNNSRLPLKVKRKPRSYSFKRKSWNQDGVEVHSDDGTMQSIQEIDDDESRELVSENEVCLNVTNYSRHS